MAVIEHGDVADNLGRTLSATEQTQVTKWIGFAEALIEARLGDLTELDQALLAYVVTEAVSERVKRPDGAVQVQVSVDDASTSRTYERSTGQITIHDEWWSLLSPATDSGVGFSTRPTFEADEPAVDSWA